MIDPTDSAATTEGWAFRAPEPVLPPRPGPDPRFSIIIAAYNVAEFLGEAVASALAQTCPAHEIIVCDDGSTDDVDTAIAPYLEEVVLLRQTNQGEGAAKNAAVAAATGDYVVILDGDDVDDARRLEALTALARVRPDLDILSTDCHLVEDGKVMRRYHESVHPYEVEDQRRAILHRNFIFNPAVRRERWVAIGGFDRSIRGAADWDCWLRLILDGSSAGLVDAPLTRYRQRPGRLTDDRVTLFDARVQVVERALVNPNLRASERQEAIASLRTTKLRLMEEALVARRRDVRRAARSIAADSMFPLGTRVRAAVAGVAPWLARSALSRRH